MRNKKRNKIAYSRNRSFDVFNERRTTLVVSDLVFVESLDMILLRLTKHATSVAVDGDIIVGHHHGVRNYWVQYQREYRVLLRILKSVRNAPPFGAKDARFLMSSAPKEKNILKYCIFIYYFHFLEYCLLFYSCSFFGKYSCFLTSCRAERNSFFGTKTFFKLCRIVEAWDPLFFCLCVHVRRKKSTSYTAKIYLSFAKKQDLSNTPYFSALTNEPAIFWKLT